MVAPVLHLSTVVGNPLRDAAGDRLDGLAAVTAAVTSTLSLVLVAVTVLGL